MIGLILNTHYCAIPQDMPVIEISGWYCAIPQDMPVIEISRWAHALKVAHGPTDQKPTLYCAGWEFGRRPNGGRPS